MTYASFDLESDGLLYAATKVHCICIVDDAGKQTTEITDIPKVLTILDGYDIITSHNGACFDIPLLEKLYGWQPQAQLIDTHILSRLYEPDRFGGHSIAAWAKKFDMEKVGGGIDDWSRLTEEMLDRCMNDAIVGLMVYEWHKEFMK